MELTSVFFDNRLGIGFNYYIKEVNDLLINRVIAPTTGFSSLLDNLGSLENKGFEIIVNGGIIRKNDLRWDVTGIFNHNLMIPLLV